MRLYIHIPFCIRKCPYCDFVSFPSDRDKMDAYLRALTLEMRLVHRREGGGRLESVYLGGGTPSLYHPRELGQLLEEAASLWGLEEGAEVSVEVNPATWGKGEFREARWLGFNRMSVGVQSFSRRALEVLGRAHGPWESLEAVRSALSLDGVSVGLDLIYGIPGQGVGEWAETLQSALQLRPHHLSLYLLTPEPGTPLAEEVARGFLSLPGEEEVVAMYEVACRMAADHGYRHYEVSNFALPGHACRHNLAYWRREGYLGLGVAAHSFIPPRRRWSNPTDLGVYLSYLEREKLPPQRDELLTPEEAREEEAMLALRTAEGLRRSFLGEEEGGRRTLGWLEQLREEGLVWLGEDAFGLTERGMFVSNAVLSAFLSG